MDTIGFNPREETSKAFVWILFPNLPPELFAKQSLLPVALAAGKPIAVDKAIQEKSRHSTARVKLELDLLAKLPQRMKLQYVDDKSGKITECMIICQVIVPFQINVANRGVTEDGYERDLTSKSVNDQVQSEGDG
ncbi:hypothetical protein BC332_20685 [Capsicum chinense]|nr:hypothetical protein BC332_20685 [Capsicum chinense]